MQNHQNKSRSAYVYSGYEKSSLVSCRKAVLQKISENSQKISLMKSIFREGSDFWPVTVLLISCTVNSLRTPVKCSKIVNKYLCIKKNDENDIIVTDNKKSPRYEKIVLIDFTLHTKKRLSVHGK